MIKNLVNSGIHANSIVFSPEGENLVCFKTKVMLKYGSFRVKKKSKSCILIRYRILLRILTDCKVFGLWIK